MLKPYSCGNYCPQKRKVKNTYVAKIKPYFQANILSNIIEERQSIGNMISTTYQLSGKRKYLPKANKYCENFCLVAKTMKKIKCLHTDLVIIWHNQELF